MFRNRMVVAFFLCCSNAKFSQELHHFTGGKEFNSHDLVRERPSSRRPSPDTTGSHNPLEFKPPLPAAPKYVRSTSVLSVLC